MNIYGILFELVGGKFKLAMMEWKAVVRFLGDRAYYEVIPEQHGIYQARLVQYEGPSGITPPENVTLVKGIRRWNGSYEEQDFLNELGNAIENKQRSLNVDPSQRSEPLNP
jgi:hypothetical protein